MALDPYAAFRNTQKSRSVADSVGAWQTDGGGGGGGSGFGGGGFNISGGFTSRPGSHSESSSEQSAIDAGALAAQYRQDRWAAMWPWLQGQMGGLLSSAPGGSSGPSPEITVGGVFNPQQIQQRVNAARASNDQAMRTTQRGQAEQLAGQGFGSSSPLLHALYGQAAAANQATNTANERELRNNAAEVNAKHVLSTQGARESQHASRMQEDIERRRNQIALYSNLLSAITSMA